MDYATALTVLKSLRRGPRPPPSDAPSEELTIPNLDGKLNVRGKPAILGMDEWFSLLGYSSDQIQLPGGIHIAGTKGKGSTCAYVECLLRQHGRRTGHPRKTGLYTSPHLNNVQERIRIDFEPLSEGKFAQYVSDVYEKLGIPTLGPNGPKYLQFLFLVSLHAFIQEGVEVAIYETHHGGEYDATNVISMPLVTAITPIDRDHMNELGPTLEHVAWHKSGILKPGVPAFSALQQPALADVLRRRAEEKGATLQFVDPQPGSAFDVPETESPVQLANISLACAISDEFLRQKWSTILTAFDKKQAMRSFSWPGRFQTVSAGSTTWFLDCAHNELSLKVCAEWFARRTVDLDVHRILIFSHFSKHRDHTSLLESLACSLFGNRVSVHDAVFVPCTDAAIDSKDAQFEILNMYVARWKRVYPKSHVSTASTPEEALDLATNSNNDQIHVLVTGSIHLIGKASKFLGV